MNPSEWKSGFCDICSSDQKKTTTISGSTYSLTVCEDCYNDTPTTKIKFSPCFNPFNETGRCTLSDEHIQHLISSGIQRSRCSNCIITHHAREYQEAGGILELIHKNPLLKSKPRATIIRDEKMPWLTENRKKKVKK